MFVYAREKFQYGRLLLKQMWSDCNRRPSQPYNVEQNRCTETCHFSADSSGNGKEVLAIKAPQIFQLFSNLNQTPFN
jgi:hypothetical protein